MQWISSWRMAKITAMLVPIRRKIILEISSTSELITVSWIIELKEMSSQKILTSWNDELSQPNQCYFSLNDKPRCWIISDWEARFITKDSATSNCASGSRCTAHVRTECKTGATANGGLSSLHKHSTNACMTRWAAILPIIAQFSRTFIVQHDRSVVSFRDYYASTH